MAMEWFSCKGSCLGSDPTSDTVKVNPALLAAGKENVQPMQVRNEQKEQEEKRRAEEEFARKQKEAEERRQAEVEAKRRREEKEAARRREEQEAEERAAAERAAAEEAAAAARAKEEKEKEHLRLEAERAAAEERARQEREAAERAALLEAQKREEERLAQEKVNSWCKTNGFGDVNSKKKSFMSGSKFPLHEAVAKNNEEIVGLLVQLGADKSAKNSKGQTAEDLARKMNKGGSMDGILAKLA